MRVAFIGVGHWHAPEFYLPALLNRDVEMVGISDADREAVDRIGAEFDLDCPQFTDFRELLDEVEADIVWSSAPHDEMAQIAAELIRREQPFHMEKPMGLDWTVLQPLAARAEQKALFTSVALVSRHYGMVQRLRQMREGGELGTPVHYYYRLFAGSPERYVEAHCEWMLDPARSGGGPLFNFGPHVIDLFIYLIDDVREVTARWSHGLRHAEIEDHASLTMVGAETGAVGVGEVSYTMPEGYERYFSVTTDRLHVGGDVGDEDLAMREGRSEHVSGMSGLEVYDHYVGDTLDRFQAGERAVATISDMVPVLRVMNAAVESAAVGNTVVLG
ncbi:MAG: Gfo/Idh/MocA family oxidoreductase [Armatimonadota bacterium]|nr:Gfo/Idh/MocA family oxidoreductase [Armatimonadota bacterium]